MTACRVSELIVDSVLALELMHDMTLYELVPDLIPLRTMVLTAYSQLEKHQKAGPVDDRIIREWHKELADSFFQRITMMVRGGRTAQLAKIKCLLRERHKLSVDKLILLCPGVGRVEV